MLSTILLTAAIVSQAPQPLPIAWGTATSAYQIEGGWNQDGKGPSVWDTYFNDPSRAGDPNAFVANDHYNRMVEDIAYLGQLNAKIYRFSLNWARILPNCTGEPNPAGIAFYNNMINEIIKNGAIPLLTLFHWETPQACHDQYGSWTNSNIVDDFEYFADIVFQNFGDRLEYILTINEPTAFCGWGYRGDFWPPGANLGEEALYICNHNVNLCHGRVAKMAAAKYPQYGLKFGMPLIVSYGVPLTDSAADLKASDDHNAAQTDMHFSPMLTGDYSDAIKTVVTMYSNGPLLPAFTDAEKEMMRGTIDFVALNYYSANYVSASQSGGFPSLGPVSGTPWQTVYPRGNYFV
jgi:beta-glucosidase